MNHPTFGGPDTFYARATHHPGGSRESQHIEAMLKRQDPELEQRVERTFKEWNATFREYVRAATGLRLTV